eukprot:SAG25_NODE_274_length_10583_cov_9.951068_13_plen_48_part_01
MFLVGLETPLLRAQLRRPRRLQLSPPRLTQLLQLSLVGTFDKFLTLHY